MKKVTSDPNMTEAKEKPSESKSSVLNLPNFEIYIFL
jgi:hypothetical protein